MYAWHPPRTLSAASAVAIVGAMCALLVLGLNIQRTAQTALHLVSLDLTAPPPPPKTEKPKTPKPHASKPAAKHEASAQNVRNKATAVVAPPVKPIIPPPPVVTAPKAGIGAAANNGASNLPGPGQGAGGNGNGFGGGGLGGEGDGQGDGSPPIELNAQLSLDDLPTGFFDNDARGISMEVLFIVLTNGRAANCQITHSSGYPNIDAQVCRKIEQRFRFRPALDADGHPVRSGMFKSLYFGPRGR